MEDIKTLTKQALSLHQQGNFDEASKIYEQILAISPENADVLNLFGLLNYQKKNYGIAIEHIKKAVKISPNAYFYENLGRIYTDNGNTKEAIESFKSGLKLEPENFEIWFNLAKTFKQNGQYNNAIKAYRIALNINPSSPEIYFNLGGIFELQDKTEVSVQCYKKALKFTPNDIETNYFLAISYLKIKDFENGWKAFECRPSKALSILTQMKQHNELISKTPEWMGEDLKDKTIYVYYEAGYGDTIMFARYLPMLAKHCKKVLFAPQKQLVSLFKNNFPNIEIITSENEHDLKFDYHVPIMSLAYKMENITNKIPFDEGYLKAERFEIEYFKEKYFKEKSFKIGIKWEGNSEIGLDRIIPVNTFEEIAKIPNVKLYSLQKGDGEDEIKNCNFEITNLSPEFSDFSKTAAAIENLDLVICNDTSIAHLTGALSKPCWVMLPHSYNWRWHNDLSFSPWYKSVKLFRQDEKDDWQSVITKISSKLKVLVNRHNQL